MNMNKKSSFENFYIRIYIKIKIYIKNKRCIKKIKKI